MYPSCSGRCSVNTCGVNEWPLPVSLLSSRRKKMAITSQPGCCHKVLVPWKSIQVNLPLASLLSLPRDLCMASQIKYRFSRLDLKPSVVATWSIQNSLLLAFPNQCHYWSISYDKVANEFTVIAIHLLIHCLLKNMVALLKVVGEI